MSVLLRFALSRQLNVLLPHAGNILNNNAPRLPRLIEHPKSPPFFFDILCNHFIFNADRLRPFFPNDTKYVAIVREPWQLIQSAYHYFRNVEHRQYLKAIPSFEDYLPDPLRFEPKDTMQSFTLNRMSTDLGLPREQMRNASYTATFVQQLNRTFHLVLIAERFQESMVLLKRLLHWQTKDILYVKLNQHAHEVKEQKEIDPESRKRIERLNHHDLVVYQHFSAVFQQKVDAEGPSFGEEVKAYAKLLDKLASFCRNQSTEASVTMDASKWNAEFKMNISDCKRITMRAVPLIDFVRNQQLGRMSKRGSSDSHFLHK